MKELYRICTLIITCCAVTALIVLNLSGVYKKSQYPEYFVEFKTRSKNGTEYRLLNSSQITTVEVVFDPTVPPDKRHHPSHVDYLEVYMSDGRKIKVEESMKKFYTRVRNSRN